MTISNRINIIGRRSLLAGGAALVAAPAVHAPFVHAQGRNAGVALVIGNSKYQWEAQLPNVRRDAPDVAKRLQAFGFKTDLVQDAGRDAMRRAIDAFSSSARGANTAALYFAGHGAAWGKDTFLVPVDADLSNPETAKTLLPVNALSAGMDAANSRLLVFDNCRNNPADGWQQKEAEQSAFIGDLLASKPSAPNTLMLFSTAPGRIALDGPAGENSPFAANLLRQFDSGAVDLQTLPEKLRRDLLIATAGRQVLFDISTYGGSFRLQGTPGKTAAGGGWAGDPSKIVELTNAYAWSDQNGMKLPLGLIAHRPPANSPHAAKVGAFKFENQTPDGKVPGVIVVLSVEEKDAAEVIFLTRMGGRGGWRFVRPWLKGDTLSYEIRARGPEYTFKWKDANSGELRVLGPERGGRRPPPFTSQFTRLD